MRTLVLAALAVAGCEREPPHEVLGLTVDLSGEVPVFDWDGSAAHAISVGRCVGECRCSDVGHPEYDQLTVAWAVGWHADTPLEEVAASEPFVVPPVTCGQPFAEDGRGVGPDPLEPGETYLVELQRVTLGETDGVVWVDAQGCATFTP